MASNKSASTGHTRNQYFAALSANILMFGFGCGVGWFSPALPLLLSSDTPLSSGPLTTEQLSLSGSILSIGGLTGSVFFGYLMIQIGTKKTLMLLVVPQLVSWFFIQFGTIAEHISLSRYFTGVVGGGVQTCMVLYIAEIADDDIRGKLGTSYQLSRSFGVLLAYGQGMVMNYIEVSTIYIAISILFAISFFFVPATPQYLLRIGANEKAKDALRFYKGHPKGDESKELQVAFDRLQMILKESREETDFSWRDIFEPVARKGLIIGLVLAFLSQSCGSYVFITFASTIFMRSGTNFSAEWSSIVLALVQIAGTFLAARFVETQGRKPLLIISLIGCTFGLMAMAAYTYCDSIGFDMPMFTWVPVTSLGFVILISSVGIIPLSLICLVEILPSKVRSFGLTIATSFMCLSAFGIVIAFPILMEIIDLHGCMLIFAATCAFGIFFVIFYVDETRGRTLDLLKGEKSNATTDEHYV